jgi:hypothetical protein
MSNMHNPAHPGEVLREYLPEGVSIGEVAKRLGVTRQALSALLILHLNVKYCDVGTHGAGIALRVGLGRKHFQSVDDAH